MGLVFVDCEAYGGCPAVGRLTWFGAVTQRREEFDGLIVTSRASQDNPAVPEPTEEMPDYIYRDKMLKVFTRFDEWLVKVSTSRPVFVSDNVAYDWQWINDGFWRTLGRNPFGHSGRRISDYYAGLTGDWSNTQKWKRFRVTPHDHNPVHDALGNLEAWERLQKGER